MKFPKSMHADGWDNHFDAGASAAPSTTVTPHANPTFKHGVRAGAKPVSANTPLHGEPLLRSQTARVANPSAYSQATAERLSTPASTAVSREPRSSALPWAIGAGVGALLIGGAVVMSRSMPHRDTTPTPVVVGQATPSPEEAQLKAAPPSAGPVTATADAAATSTPAEAVAKTDAPAPQVVAEAPAVTPTPAATRAVAAPALVAPAATTVAAAPVARVQTPAPVIRTLTPQPEVLAQASPAPTVNDIPLSTAPVPAPAATTLTDMPAAVAPNSTPVPAVAPPVSTSPGTPPLAQAPATPAVGPDPVDTGISSQVRQALAADTALSTARIAVSTDHGVVKLEGQAPDAQAREHATVVASSTNGVKAVDNRLTLPPMAALDAQKTTVASGG